MLVGIAAVIAAIALAVGGWFLTARGAHSPDATSCPVTRPPEPGFTPPKDWPSRPAHEVWFGSADLWTKLPRDGSTPARGKSVWWSANLPNGALERQPDIEVTWRRVDDPTAERVRARSPGSNASTVEDGRFMIAGSGDPDLAGCWKVTASYKGHRLSYVYDVTPRLWKQGPSDDGVLGDLQGRVTYDAARNCYFLDGIDHSPVVWPIGTTASGDGRTLRIGSGSIVHVGDSVRGGGYTGDLTEIAVFGIPPSCSTEGNVAIFNSHADVRVTS